MAYCRWSSDNGKCDVYVYSDVFGGYTTHVARQKPDRNLVPKEPDWASFSSNEERHKASMAWGEALVMAYKPIGLAHDGETFNDPDLQSLLNRLLHLRTVGYHVPDSVLERIKGEMSAATSKVTMVKSE